MMKFSRINKKAVIPCIFYGLVFFPFLWSPLPTDTAPYALLISVLILVSYRPKKLPITIAYLYLPAIMALSLLIVQGAINFTSIRSFLGYASVPIIATATFLIGKKYPFKKAYFNFVINVWILVGCIQIIFGREFLTFLLARSTSSVERGVTSLAVEPAYFGLMLVLLLFLGHIKGFLDNKNILKCVFALFLLAQSTTAAFLLVLFAINCTFHKLNLKLILLSLSIIVLLIYIVENADNRLSTLLKITLENPTDLLQDASANSRFFGFWLPFKLGFQNYLLPHGFGNYVSTVLVYGGPELELLSDEFYFTLSDKIMSALGQIIYEIGIFGVTYFYILFLSMQRLGNSKIASLGIVFFFMAVLTTAMPLTLPIVGFIYGTALHRGKND